MSDLLKFTPEVVEPDLTIRDGLDILAKVRPSTWSMYHRTIKGAPYTFDVSRLIAQADPTTNKREHMQLLLRHRPFLVQPLNDMHPHKVYKKGRQVGVSELSVTEALWFLDSHPNTKLLYCVPDDAEILTRDGWKRHREVVLGQDETLALDPVTHVSRWEPITHMNRFPWSGDLMPVGPFHCTDDHRWPVQVRETVVGGKRYGGERKVVTASELNQLHLIPRLAPHAHDGSPSVLSPRLAAILGWVVTDGHQYMSGTSPNLTTVMMHVVQSSKKYLTEVEALLGTERQASKYSDAPTVAWGGRGGRVVGYTSGGNRIYGDVYLVRVKREDIDAIVAAGYRGKEDFPSIVSRLSPEAGWAMFNAMVKAEGNVSGPRLSSLSFPQNPGPVLDGFQVLTTLLGGYANLSERGAYVTAPNTQKAWLKAKNGAANAPRRYSGTVWCPTTPSGTWFMRYRGKVVFTGNCFPREKQLTDFSTTRITEAMAESLHMRHLFGTPNQTFLKKVGESSFLLLRSAWESNLGEGVDADVVVFDEKDRMKEGIEVAFRESLSSSKYGLLREVSTPTLPGRGVDASYMNSDQMEWHMRCTKCSMWQTIEFPENVIQMMDFEHGIKELPEGAYAYKCRKEKCRGDLDRIHGYWVPKYPSRGNIRGYLIPQTICPWITATQLMQKKINYKFQQLWENYVLGRTSVGEHVMLSPEDFENATAGHEMVGARTPDWDQITVGIDWGDLNWVVVIGRNVHNGRKYLINLSVFEDDVRNELESVKKAELFIAPFQPDMIVADAGYGKDRNAYLLRKYPGKMYACWYNPSERGSRTFMPSWSDAFSKVLCDRTLTLKNTCRWIRERELGLPRYDKAMQLFQKHFEALAPMREEEEGEIFETIQATGPDHLVHATGYAVIAMERIEASFSSFSYDFVS
jgi:Phage terminase large subunit (GpA)